MKHQEADWTQDPDHCRRLQSMLLQGAEQLGVDLTNEAAACMIEYLQALVRKNRTINLTRIVEPEDAVRLHLLDSLTAVPELLGAPVGDVLDLGSGGGLPGVPLAIVTGRRVLLVDSVRKKARAVTEILDELTCTVPAETRPGRAEELAGMLPGRFSVVLARAVAPLPSLVELASPLLSAGGRLIAMKGRPSDEELASGIGAARLSGMGLASIRRCTLPFSDEERAIVVYEKTGSPRVNLPRRPGMAQHMPLA